MVTKIIKGKKYELYEYYTTLAEAKKSAKNLDGRLNMFTGKITESTITKLTKSVIAPCLYRYAVWTRKKE